MKFIFFQKKYTINYKSKISKIIAITTIISRYFIGIVVMSLLKLRFGYLQYGVNDTFMLPCIVIVVGCTNSEQRFVRRWKH